MTMIPKLAGLSDLQRKGGRIFEPIKNGGDEVIFLTDHNDIFGVTMSLQHYEALTKAAQNLENDFWLSANERALDFWHDKSNDIYETCL